LSAPVDGDGHEREDAGRDRARRDELSEPTVAATERPVAVDHVDEVEERVEDRDQRVGDGQVHQEVVDDGAHALVRDDHPDDDGISARGDDDDEDERDDVDELELPAERVLRCVAGRL